MAVNVFLKDESFKDGTVSRDIISKLEARIGELEKVEERLRESKKIYRAVFENTGTATIIIENDMTISLVNAEFEKLSGYSKNEIEGRMAFTRFIAEESLDMMKKYHRLRRDKPDEAPRNYEFCFVNRDGIKKTIYLTIGLIAGTFQSVASFLDVTSAKKTQSALVESEKRFRELVENSLTGVLIIQGQRIVYQNPEQQRLFNFMPADFKKIEFKNIYPDDILKVRAFYDSIISRNTRRLDCDFRFYPPGKQGSRSALKWVYCRASIIDFRGEEAILINMMDTTKAKNLEHLLTIKDKMASLGHIAAGIAHEIRNPLSGINIFLDNIKENFNDPSASEDMTRLIGQAQEAANRIESVIKKVLDFSRPGQLKLEYCDIKKPINGAVELSSASLKAYKIMFKKTVQENLPLVLLDSQLIEQVLLNLITNAAEAMKDKSRQCIIELKVSEQSGFVVINVSDSGMGISDDIKKEIFDPFFSTKQYGSGIGLSICQRIITDHSGTIEAEKSPLGGACFTIKLPVNKPELS